MEKSETDTKGHWERLADERMSQQIKKEKQCAEERLGKYPRLPY